MLPLVLFVVCVEIYTVEKGSRLTFLSQSKICEPKTNFG